MLVFRPVKFHVALNVSFHPFGKVKEEVSSNFREISIKSLKIERHAKGYIVSINFNVT